MWRVVLLAATFLVALGVAVSGALPHSWPSLLHDGEVGWHLVLFFFQRHPATAC